MEPEIPKSKANRQKRSGLSQDPAARKERSYLHHPSRFWLPQSDDEDLTEPVAEKPTVQNSLAYGMSSVNQLESIGAQEAQSVSNSERGSAPWASSSLIPRQEPANKPGTDGESDRLSVDELSGPSSEKAKGKSSVQYAWLEKSLSLEKRVSEFKSYTESVSVLRSTWKSGGKPACETCGGAHAPPCNFDINSRREAMALGHQLQKEFSDARKRNSIKPPKAKGVEDETMDDAPIKKKRPIFCRICAKRHLGGAVECKAPFCTNRDCRLNHFPTEACARAQRRFRDAGLLEEDSPAPARPSRNDSKPTFNEEELDMLSSMFEAIGPADARQFGQFITHLAKRKAEGLESREAQRPTKKAKKAESEDSDQKPDQRVKKGLPKRQTQKPGGEFSNGSKPEPNPYGRR